MPPYRSTPVNAKTQKAPYGQKPPMLTCSTCQRREGVVRRFTQGKYTAHMRRFH
jgi:hypothetical protein